MMKTTGLWKYIAIFMLPGIFACTCFSGGIPAVYECQTPPDFGVEYQATQEIRYDPTLTPMPDSDPGIPVRGFYCTITPIPGVAQATATPDAGVFNRGDISNNSLNLGNAITHDAAINEDGSILAWTEDSHLLVLIDRKNYTDMSRIDWASTGSVAFSDRGRAHLVFQERHPSFILRYRAADGGQFFDQRPDNFVGSGNDPEVILDNDGWANIFYENYGEIIHKVQRPDGWTEPGFRLGVGEFVEAISQEDGTLLAAVVDGDVITISRFNGSWTAQQAYYVPDLVGEPQFDTDGNVSYIAWITEEISDDAAPAHGFNTLSAAYSLANGEAWSEAFVVTVNERDGETSGRIAADPFPIIARHAEDPRVMFAYIYEEGDPPEEVPDALRYGRLRVTRCEIGGSACFDEAPGLEPFDRDSFTPSDNLVINTNRSHTSTIMGWTGLQVGERAREAYSGFFNPQALAELP